jgi:hypothetical protein
MSDEELWSALRADAASADVDPGTAAAIRQRAHARLREPAPTLRTTIRAIESVGVAAVAVAQIAWAWSVVLR